jgi:hypothetical protein
MFSYWISFLISPVIFLSRIAPVTMHGWGQTPLSVRVYPVPEVGWNIDVWILSTGK